MSLEVIILLLLVLAFGAFVFYKESSKTKTAPRSLEEKKEEIIKHYKKMLDEELAAYVNEPKILKAKKTALLSKISHELARNIYFDQNQMKELIQELITYEIKRS